jgi:hypothetical protein
MSKNLDTKISETEELVAHDSGSPSRHGFAHHLATSMGGTRSDVTEVAWKEEEET